MTVDELKEKTREAFRYLLDLIKRQTAEIEEMDDDIAELRDHIDLLEARVSELEAGR